MLLFGRVGPPPRLAIMICICAFCESIPNHRWYNRVPVQKPVKPCIMRTRVDVVDGQTCDKLRVVVVDSVVDVVVVIIVACVWFANEYIMLYLGSTCATVTIRISIVIDSARFVSSYAHVETIYYAQFECDFKCYLV